MMKTLIFLLLTLCSCNAHLRGQRILQEQTYPVVMFMELKYLNDSTAALLENNTPNDLLSHFCKIVNLQATGNQVDNVAQVLGATIDTKVIQTSTPYPDYECQIMDSNRAYDNDAEDTLGQGFFILEVAVQQIVYVTSAEPLTLQQVTEAVETGFNRGSGGRVKFRSLLKEFSGFASLITVEMLDGSLSSPQTPPSMEPSASPSSLPSTSPSVQPNALPSSAPSWLPSASPTTTPSSSPSLQSEQTSSPTTSAPATDDPDRPKKKNLIIGAIMGGMFTILVSCFFIFCVWFPLCAGDEESRAEQRQTRGKTYVPGEVNLHDGSESLANTTLGDPTMARRSGKGGLSPNGTMNSGITESFDENSLYTSSVLLFDTNDPSQQYSLKVLPIPLDHTEEYDDGIADPFTAVVSNDSDEEFEDCMPHPSITRILDEVADTIRFSPSDNEIGESFPMIPPSRSQEDKAMEVSNRASLGSRSLDPFDDGSSSSSYNFHDSSSEDESDVNDMRVRNLIAGSFPRDDDLEYPVGVSDEEKREVVDEIREDIESEHSTTESYDDIMQNVPKPVRLTTNDLLLRSVLEGSASSSRSLSKRSRASRNSRVSRKSAPPTIYEGKAGFDIVADTQELENLRVPTAKASKRKSKSSKSLGGSSPRRAHAYRSVFRDSRSVGDASMAKKRPGLLGARSGGALWEHLSKNSGDSMIHDSAGILGIPQTDAKAPPTPSSSDTDGTTGQWLMGNIEQTLGPRSSNADVESLSGRSTMSNKSQRSTKSTKSSRSVSSKRSIKSSFVMAGFTSEEKIDHALNGKPLGSFPMAPTLSGEQKSDFDVEVASMPRSLEHDLQRLELQLADVMKKTLPSQLDERSVARSTTSSKLSAMKRSTIQKIVVMAPPGKVGIVLANRNDGNGTVISEVRESSKLSGHLFPGDKLIAVDDTDVSRLLVSEITALMSSKSDRERKLTIVTNDKHGKGQEEKSTTS